MIKDMCMQNSTISTLPSAFFKEGLELKKYSSNNYSFKDIFGGTVNSQKAQNTASSNNIRDEEAIRIERYEKRCIKNFSELQKRIGNDAVKSSFQTGKNTSDVEKCNSKPEAGDKADKDAVNANVVNYLANVLGLRADEFTAIMEKAGVTFDELTNLADADRIAEKIAVFAGLSGEQKDVLEQLINLAADNLSSRLGKQTLGNENSIAFEGSGPVSGKVDGDTSNFNFSIDEIINTGSNIMPNQFHTSLVKLRLMLDDISNKENNEGLNLAEAVETKPDEILNDMNNGLESAENGLTSGIELLKSEESIIKSATDKDDSKAFSKYSKDPDQKNIVSEDNAASSDTIAVDKAVSNNDAAAASNSLNFNQIQKSEIRNVQGKADLKAAFQVKDVVNQVVEKAKMVITHEKSEMIMDLKPDSLGKLSLKVVTEQGIVMAKFVAESEQVKQILETNMQLLKDSLEKQGMNVQGFSVSVRQDNQFTSGNWQNRDTQRQIIKESIMPGIRNTCAFTATEVSGSLSGNNPYNWGGSTINLTA